MDIMLFFLVMNNLHWIVAAIFVAAAAYILRVWLWLRSNNGRC
jgi:hypothetical protein